MKIMFIGLGLIGGSMALALHGWPDAEMYAVDADDRTRFEALNRGVDNVIIMDGRIHHSILMELLTDEGAGTMVTKG